MDVMRLNATDYKPMDLIEGYDSMIWTERYIGGSEFELLTYKVWETLDILPQGSLISLRDSNEVMIVETRNIEADEDGTLSLKITGRSIETFLENRIMIPAVYNQSWPMLKLYSPSEMAGLLLWNHLVNTSGEDVTQVNRPIDSMGAFPNVVVTDSESVPEAKAQWYLEKGQVYPQFVDFLAISDLGVRAYRGIDPDKLHGEVLTFDTTRTASRGTVIRTGTDNISDLRLDIYSGMDRSRNQSVRPQVIFHYDSGHIENPSYLFSIKEYKTMALVHSSVGNMDVYLKPANADLTGRNRRLLFIDGGDAGDQDHTTFTNALIQKGKQELSRHNQVRLFDGKISSVIPYEYNKDYYLGDKVTLLAQLGFEQTMLVSEYVRTEDSQGDSGYPGLSEIL